MSPPPIRVLAVDDRPDNLLAIQAALRDPSYEIVLAHSGEEALRFLLENDCALILMDVQMPRMDGFETARLIRSSARSRETPIIFLTAISKDQTYVARGYAGGAVDYLFKPFEPEILKAKVGVFAALYRSRLELERQAALQKEHEAADRRRALAELEVKSLKREQVLQQRYRDLVNGISHAVIWSADPISLQPTFVSPSALEIFGEPPERWLQPGFWAKCLRPDERERVETELRRAATEGPVVLEHSFARKDGSFAWLQTSARITHTEDGSPELHGLSIDLTRQKEAEEALRLLGGASSHLARSLQLDEALSGLFSMLVPRYADWCVVELCGEHEGSRGPFLHATPESEQTLAPLCESGSFIPRTDGEVVAGAQVYDLLEPATRDRLGISSKQLECLSALGTAALLIIPLTAGGRVRGALTLGTVGGRKMEAPLLAAADELGRRTAQAFENARLYSELQESLRVREDFLSVASHELRTPLTPLKLHVDALATSVQQPSVPEPLRISASRRLSATQRQLDRLVRLVESLLDVTRIRTGKVELKFEEVDLGTILQEVLSRARDELARDGIQVSVRSVGALVGRWDPFRLDQVVTNLVSNAIKYGRQRPIHIVATEHDDAVQLDITDEGIGIPGPNPERVFERFERAVDARSYGGLGLGLYITRQVVELHGGVLSLVTQVGVGSTFSVKLPKSPAIALDAVSATATASDEAEAHGRAAS